jgi:hypothetical protein
LIHSFFKDKVIINVSYITHWLWFMAYISIDRLRWICKFDIWQLTLVTLQSSLDCPLVFRQPNNPINSPFIQYGWVIQNDCGKVWQLCSKMYVTTVWVTHFVNKKNKNIKIWFGYLCRYRSAATMAFLRHRYPIREKHVHFLIVWVIIVYNQVLAKLSRQSWQFSEQYNRGLLF